MKRPLRGVELFSSRESFWAPGFKTIRNIELSTYRVRGGC